jgi:hypothetical protein
MWDFRFSRRRVWRWLAVLWVVAPCSPAEVYRPFRDACCLHHQASSSWWRQKAPLKRRETSTRLHGATTQKTAIFEIKHRQINRVRNQLMTQAATEKNSGGSRPGAISRITLCLPAEVVLPSGYLLLSVIPVLHKLDLRLVEGQNDHSAVITQTEK